MCLLTVWGLVFSQSRSAWLAFGLVMPVTAICKLRHARKIEPKALLLIVCILLISASVINITKIIEKRLGSKIDSVSVSARRSLYQIAWENWKKHPLVGRGPGTLWIMIQQAGEEYADVKSLDHLHNVVLDIAAQAGVVGIAFYVLSFFMIISQAINAKDANGLELEYILFGLGGIVLIFLTGIPNQPLSSPHGVYLVAFLNGICYSNKFDSFYLSDSLP
jgi:O-antigen ligase